MAQKNDEKNVGLFSILQMFKSVIIELFIDEIRYTEYLNISMNIVYEKDCSYASVQMLISHPIL